MNYLELHSTFKCQDLYDRYITNSHIKPVLESLPNWFKVSIIGKSVEERSIYAVEVGSGKTNVLMWSQMHGNESTTTKAVFDLFNILQEDSFKYILKKCTLYIIPILNPDGAYAYTRLNANQEDLNRDAQIVSQPESLVLKEAYNQFKPDFCFNLHGQRTIFSAGETSNPATVSFLAPAQDAKCTITPSRKIAMEIIVNMNASLQNFIPYQVGIYDDAFNINCIGDTFQSFNVPTILFEAGHYKNDYKREVTRKYIFIALLSALNYISKTEITGELYEGYLNIPENKKLFFDVLIRNCKLANDEKYIINDVGVLYKEELRNNKVVFLPIIEKISNLKKFHGHIEVDASNNVVLDVTGKALKVGFENDFVLIKNELFSLNVEKN